MARARAAGGFDRVAGGLRLASLPFTALGRMGVLRTIQSRDAYRVLGVHPGGSLAAIVSAYKSGFARIERETLGLPNAVFEGRYAKLREAFGVVLWSRGRIATEQVRPDRTRPVTRQTAARHATPGRVVPLELELSKPIRRSTARLIRSAKPITSRLGQLLQTGKAWEERARKQARQLADRKHQAALAAAAEHSRKTRYRPEKPKGAGKWVRSLRHDAVHVVVAGTLTVSLFFPAMLRALPDPVSTASSPVAAVSTAVPGGKLPVKGIPPGDRGLPPIKDGQSGGLPRDAVPVKALEPIPVANAPPALVKITTKSLTTSTKLGEQLPAPRLPLPLPLHPPQAQYLNVFGTMRWRPSRDERSAARHGLRAQASIARTIVNEQRGQHNLTPAETGGAEVRKARTTQPKLTTTRHRATHPRWTASLPKNWRGSFRRSPIGTSRLGQAAASWWNRGTSRQAGNHDLRPVQPNSVENGLKRLASAGLPTRILRIVERTVREHPTGHAVLGRLFTLGHELHGRDTGGAPGSARPRSRAAIDELVDGLELGWNNKTRRAVLSALRRDVRGLARPAGAQRDTTEHPQATLGAPAPGTATTMIAGTGAPGETVTAHYPHRTTAENPATADELAKGDQRPGLTVERIAPAPAQGRDGRNGPLSTEPWSARENHAVMSAFREWPGDVPARRSWFTRWIRGPPTVSVTRDALRERLAAQADPSVRLTTAERAHVLATMVAYTADGVTFLLAEATDADHADTAGLGAGWPGRVLRHEHWFHSGPFAWVLRPWHDRHAAHTTAPLVRARATAPAVPPSVDTVGEPARVDEPAVQPNLPAPRPARPDSAWVTVAAGWQRALLRSRTPGGALPVRILIDLVSALDSTRLSPAQATAHPELSGVDRLLHERKFAAYRAALLPLLQEWTGTDSVQSQRFAAAWLWTVNLVADLAPALGEGNETAVTVLRGVGAAWRAGRISDAELPGRLAEALDKVAPATPLRHWLNRTGRHPAAEDRDAFHPLVMPMPGDARWVGSGYPTTVPVRRFATLERFGFTRHGELADREHRLLLELFTESMFETTKGLAAASGETLLHLGHELRLLETGADPVRLAIALHEARESLPGTERTAKAKLGVVLRVLARLTEQGVPAAWITAHLGYAVANRYALLDGFVAGEEYEADVLSHALRAIRRATDLPAPGWSLSHLSLSALRENLELPENWLAPPRLTEEDIAALFADAPRTPRIVHRFGTGRWQPRAQWAVAILLTALPAAQARMLLGGLPKNRENYPALARLVRLVTAPELAAYRPGLLELLAHAPAGINQQRSFLASWLDLVDLVVDVAPVASQLNRTAAVARAVERPAGHATDLGQWQRWLPGRATALVDALDAELLRMFPGIQPGTDLFRAWVYEHATATADTEAILAAYFDRLVELGALDAPARAEAADAALRKRAELGIATAQTPAPIIRESYVAGAARDVVDLLHIGYGMTVLGTDKTVCMSLAGIGARTAQHPILYGSDLLLYVWRDGQERARVAELQVRLTDKGVLVVSPIDAIRLGGDDLPARLLVEYLARLAARRADPILVPTTMSAASNEVLHEVLDEVLGTHPEIVAVTLPENATAGYSEYGGATEFTAWRWPSPPVRPDYRDGDLGFVELTAGRARAMSKAAPELMAAGHLLAPDELPISARAPPVHVVSYPMVERVIGTRAAAGLVGFTHHGPDGPVILIPDTRVAWLRRRIDGGLRASIVDDIVHHEVVYRVWRRPGRRLDRLRLLHELTVETSRRDRLQGRALRLASRAAPWTWRPEHLELAGAIAAGAAVAGALALDVVHRKRPREYPGLGMVSAHAHNPGGVASLAVVMSSFAAGSGLLSSMARRSGKSDTTATLLAGSAYGLLAAAAMPTDRPSAPVMWRRIGHFAGAGTFIVAFPVAGTQLASDSADRRLLTALSLAAGGTSLSIVPLWRYSTVTAVLERVALGIDAALMVASARSLARELREQAKDEAGGPRLFGLTVPVALWALSATQQLDRIGLLLAAVATVLFLAPWGWPRLRSLAQRAATRVAAAVHAVRDGRKAGTSPMSFRNYRLFYWATLASNIGTFMEQAVADWLVLRLSNHDPKALSIVVLTQTVPPLLLTPLVGWLGDRISKRAMITTAMLTLGVVSAAFTVLGFAGLLTLGWIYGLSLIAGIAWVFTNTQAAFVTELVPDPLLRNKARSLNSISKNFGRTVGPFLGALALDHLAGGAGTVYLLNTITFAGVIAALLVMRRSELYVIQRPPAEPGGERPTLRGFFARQPRGLVLLGLGFFALAFGATFFATLPLVASAHFHTSATGLGILQGVLATGAIIGAALAVSRTSQRVLLLSALLLGVLNVALGLPIGFWLFTVVLGLAGVMLGLFSQNFGNLLMNSTPDHLQARVAASADMSRLLGNVLDGAMIGVVAASFGPVTPFWLGGLVTIAATLVAAVGLLALSDDPRPIKGRLAHVLGEWALTVSLVVLPHATPAPRARVSQHARHWGELVSR